MLRIFPEDDSRLAFARKLRSLWWGTAGVILPPLFSLLLLLAKATFSLSLSLECPLLRRKFPVKGRGSALLRILGSQGGGRRRVRAGPTAEPQPLLQARLGLRRSRGGLALATTWRALSCTTVRRLLYYDVYLHEKVILGLSVYEFTASRAV